MLALAALLLTACGGSSTDTSEAVLTEAALIYSQGLTETAAVAPPTATETVPPTATFTVAIPTATPTVTGTPPTDTPEPTLPPATGGETGGATGGTTTKVGCYRAELTYETIPDGTQIEITETFKKRWVFKNVGTCAWSPDFSLIWVEGELFGAKSVTGFADYTTTDIQPGEHIDISVPMKAPDKQGTYKGYFMLRSDDGVIYGLGPNGTGWFWLEIFAKE